MKMIFWNSRISEFPKITLIKTNERSLSINGINNYPFMNERFIGFEPSFRRIPKMEV